MQGVIPRRIFLVPVLNPGLVLGERDHELARDRGVGVQGVLHQVEADALLLAKELVAAFALDPESEWGKG